MHNQKRITFISLVFVAILSACGPGETSDIGSAEIHEDGVSATACPVADPGCNPQEPEDPPEPTVRTIAVAVTNHTPQSVSASYSIVVKSKTGQVRSHMSRWGSVSLDAYGSGTISGGATAYHGDRVEFTMTSSAPGAASSMYGATILSNWNCTGAFTENWGTVTVAVNC